MSGIRYIALLGVAITCLGCGENLDPVYPVTGKVMFNGKPLSSGTVSFTPMEDGPSASGNIQEDGTYAIKSHDDREGALPGKYRVTISAVKLNSEGIALSILPSKYSSASLSGLTAEVEEKDVNTVDLELAGKPGG